ncbi:MAG: antitoxin family protein, partial [Okeania sp. SIO2H7]|nr:antitoxin family protein [Okeania sp. SIO2H7]
MNETILVDAVYENGTLKPIKPLNLTEQQVVKISLNPELVTTHP